MNLRQHNPRVPARLPADDEQKQYLLDQIMEHSCVEESLALSLSRLAAAAGFLGYDVLCPTAVFVSYRKFSHRLSSRFEP